MVQFYRKLVPQAAYILLPLTELIKKPPQSKTLQLTDVEKEAFLSIKNVLKKLTALLYLNSDVTHYHVVSDKL